MGYTPRPSEKSLVKMPWSIVYDHLITYYHASQLSGRYRYTVPGGSPPGQSAGSTVQSRCSCPQPASLTSGRLSAQHAGACACADSNPACTLRKPRAPHGTRLWLARHSLGSQQTRPGKVVGQSMLASWGHADAAGDDAGASAPVHARCKGPHAACAKTRGAAGSAGGRTTAG